MPSYNLMKAADRQKYANDRQAELTSLDDGSWPRDSNDALRWSSRHPAYVREVVQADLNWVKGVNPRILAGELPGWEPDPENAA
jgi:hypothetical protein